MTPALAHAGQMSRLATAVAPPAPPSRELPGPRRPLLSCAEHPQSLVAAPMACYESCRSVRRGGLNLENGETARKGAKPMAGHRGRLPKTTHMGLGGSMRDRYRDLCLGRHQNSFVWPRTCRSPHHLGEICRCNPAQPHPPSYRYLLGRGKRDCLCLRSCDRLNDAGSGNGRSRFGRHGCAHRPGPAVDVEHRVPPGA
jgi:hypothetical protein